MTSDMQQAAAMGQVGFALLGMDREARTVMPVDGDRMSPTIDDGDCVLVDTSADSFRGDGLYVVGEDIPQIYRVEPCKGGYRLFSDNPRYGEAFELPREKFRGLLFGKVVALGKVIDRPAMQRLIGR